MRPLVCNVGFFVFAFGRCFALFVSDGCTGDTVALDGFTAVTVLQVLLALCAQRLVRCCCSCSYFLPGIFDDIQLRCLLLSFAFFQNDVYDILSLS